MKAKPRARQIMVATGMRPQLVSSELNFEMRSRLIHFPSKWESSDLLTNIMASVCMHVSKVKPRLRLSSTKKKKK